MIRSHETEDKMKVKERKLIWGRRDLKMEKAVCSNICSDELG